MKRICCLLILFMGLLTPLDGMGTEPEPPGIQNEKEIPGTEAAPLDGEAVVRAAFDHFRGHASVSTVQMTIHRPDWERTMTLKVWTEGQTESLFTIVSPPRDQGNGTLKKGREMWMYNPKVNRVIKLPPSMMSQSWMGSDFSNNDLARSDTLITDYVHTVTGTETDEGKKVYIIESVPRPGAAVVWGMQRLKVREDHIFLEEIFYDEDLEPVKILRMSDIEMMGGKRFPRKWRMEKAEMEEGSEYTLIEYRELSFVDDLPDRLFTLSALRHPGR